MEKKKNKGMKRWLPVFGICMMFVCAFEISPVHFALAQEQSASVQDLYEMYYGKPEGGLPDPFSITAKEEDHVYEEELREDDEGLMGEIEIPSINVKAPIYHNTDPETLKKGVGHLKGSSMPIGGESTHCVLAANAKTDNILPFLRQDLFIDLTLLKEGNVFYLHVDGKTLAYEVDKMTVAMPEDTEY